MVVECGCGKRGNPEGLWGVPLNSKVKIGLSDRKDTSSWSRVMVKGMGKVP